MRTKIKFILRLITGFLFLSSLASAQQYTEEQLQKIIQNPLAYLNFLPFANSTYFGLGYNNDRTLNELDIQPVLPFRIGKHVNVITRTIFPVVTAPVDESKSVTGLGDITLDMFFTPSDPGNFIWGIGPILTFPSATIDPVRTKKWTAGPGICFLTQPKGWTLGMYAQNTWSYAGDENYPDINLFLTQIFIIKNLPDLWYISTNPIITADWKAANEDKWSIPLGFDVGRLFTFGELPVNIQAGYYYYVEKPQYMAKWTLKAEISFIFPKVFVSNF